MDAILLLMAVDGVLRWRWLFLLAALAVCGSGAEDDDLMGQVEASIRQSFKFEAEGRLDDALRAVDSDLPPSLARHPIVRYRAGKVLLQKRLWAQAMVALLEAGEKDPELSGLFSHVTFALRMLGDAASAQRALRAARALDPHDQWLAPQLVQMHRSNSIALSAPEERLLARRTARALAHAGEVTIVTAANSLYFGCVANLVGSVHQHAPGVPIVLYDIGLNDMERDSASTWSGVTVEQLDWASYGMHVTDVRIKAWKPFAIAHALPRYGTIIYQDAGQELRQGLSAVSALLHRDGYFFAVQQEKALPSFVHPGMFKQLDVEPQTVKGYDMCAAGILGLSNASALAHEVLDVMVSCARDRECISPTGSSQLSHRYEQVARMPTVSWHVFARCNVCWIYNSIPASKHPRP